MNEEMYDEFFSYTSRVKQYFPEVFSAYTKHPKGRKIFLAMIEALDNGTAGEEEKYYIEMTKYLSLVIPQSSTTQQENYETKKTIKLIL